MAKNSFSFLLLLSIISIATAIEPTLNRRSGFRAFIEQKCGGIRYFQPCGHCLSIFANPATQTPEKLAAQVALKVSLVRARYARAYITKVAKDLRLKKTKDYQAMHDCLDQINDGVDQLRNSVKELGRMSLASETDFFRHQSNVKTWMSTAFTDALTCMDWISGHAMGSKVKATIRAKVLNVVQVTSNALAFFNRYVARHRASHSNTTKT